MNKESLVFISAVGKRRRILLGICFVSLLTIPLFLKNNYLLHIMIMMLFYGVLASSWNILSGYAGQLSLGHSAFLGVGSYTLAFLYLQYDITPWIGFWIGGIMGSLVGLIIGVMTFRRGLREIYFALVTLAFSVILGLMVYNWDLFGGSVGMIIPWKGTLFSLQFKSKAVYYYLILGLMLCSVLITFSLDRSKLGYYFMCIRENEDVAKSLGINIFNTKLKAIIISSFLTGLAGGFHTLYFLHVSPEENFGLTLSMNAIMPCILGGMGSPLGPIVGAFILTPIGEIGLELLSGGKYSGFHMVIYGCILVGAIIYMPKGIIYYMGRIIKNDARGE